jgi:hypothetical protein
MRAAGMTSQSCDKSLQALAKIVGSIFCGGHLKIAKITIYFKPNDPHRVVVVYPDAIDIPPVYRVAAPENTVLPWVGVAAREDKTLAYQAFQSAEWRCAKEGKKIQADYDNFLFRL